MFTALEPALKLLSFYDNALTVNNETTIVTCCGINLRPQSVSCGHGVSCSGQCSAKDAFLCPSGVCDNCEQGLQMEEELTQERVFAPVTLPSWALSHCPRLCHSSSARSVLTRYWPLCCYHPTCKAMSVVRSKCVNHAVYLGTLEPIQTCHPSSAGRSCLPAGSIPHGQWTCSKQQVPLPSIEINGTIATFPGVLFISSPLLTLFSHPALQCQLECSPGHMSNISPVVVCVEGKYEPREPSAFKCQPAVGFLVSLTGEIEIFSGNKKCSQKLSNYVKLGLTDCSANVITNQLVIEGYSQKEGRRLQLSLEDVRGGVLANNWLSRASFGSLEIHNSYASGKDI